MPAEDGSFVIKTDEDTLRARALLLAPGVEAKRLGIPGEAEFTGRGVSWCATCDGALYEGRQVAVVGGGDSAIEEGLFLAKFADVHVIHRRDQLRANMVAQERAFANPRMHFVWDSVPLRILGEGMVTGIECQNVKTSAHMIVPVDGAFIYVGRFRTRRSCAIWSTWTTKGSSRPTSCSRHRSLECSPLEMPDDSHQADRVGGRRGSPSGCADGEVP